MAFFGRDFAHIRSHHVMDASCRLKGMFGGSQKINLRKENLIASKSRERKIDPKFSDRSLFRERPRGMSVPQCSFFQDLEGLTEENLQGYFRR